MHFLLLHLHIVNKYTYYLSLNRIVLWRLNKHVCLCMACAFTCNKMIVAIKYNRQKKQKRYSVTFHRMNNCYIFPGLES